MNTALLKKLAKRSYVHVKYCGKYIKARIFDTDGPIGLRPLNQQDLDPYTTTGYQILSIHDPNLIKEYQRLNTKLGKILYK